MAQKTLNLDLSKVPLLKPLIYGRVGDADMQTVQVNISSRDVPVDLRGYKITFEGVTSSGKTKVFDVGGVVTKESDLSLGKFNYTFPNMAFAIPGNYEIAYFSIVKNGKRDTTGEFDIIVMDNADIDAKEAETIITIYNELVSELRGRTDSYISETDAKFTSVNNQLTTLQQRITQYQATVKNTSDNAVSTINTIKESVVSNVNNSANQAIQLVQEALRRFEAGDFYRKTESNARFASKSDLRNHYTKTEAEEKFAAKNVLDTKANLSEVVRNTGEETISGKKTFTEVTAFKQIKSMDDTEPESISGNGAPSGRVTYERRNGIVFVSGSGNWGPTTTGQTKVVAKLPEGFRPRESWQIGGNAQGGNGENAWAIEANGEVKLTPNPGSSGTYSGWSTSYPAAN